VQLSSGWACVQVCDLMGVPLPADEAVPFEGTSLKPILEAPAVVTSVKSAALSTFPRCVHTGIPIYGARGTGTGRTDDDNSCLEVERTDFTWMGYTMRTDRHRYTEWVRWNGSALARAAGSNPRPLAVLDCRASHSSVLTVWRPARRPPSGPTWSLRSCTITTATTAHGPTQTASRMSTCSRRPQLRSRRSSRRSSMLSLASQMLDVSARAPLWRTSPIVRLHAIHVHVEADDSIDRKWKEARLWSALAPPERVTVSRTFLRVSHITG
jgi:hypothetical protein